MKKIKHVNCLLGLLAVQALAGCASIISESNWPVAIKSTPDGANFTVTNQNGDKVHSGTTPSSVMLAGGAGYFDGEKYTITFKKDGYQDTIATLDTSVNGWYWGNLLFGGILGFLVIDPATGAMYRLPPSFSAELPAKQHSMENNNDFNLSVLSLNDIPQELRNQLIPVQ
jgi:hypothetical protein